MVVVIVVAAGGGVVYHWWLDFKFIPHYWHQKKKGGKSTSHRKGKAKARRVRASAVSTRTGTVTLRWLLWHEWQDQWATQIVTNIYIWGFLETFLIYTEYFYTLIYNWETIFKNDDNLHKSKTWWHLVAAGAWITNAWGIACYCGRQRLGSSSSQKCPWDVQTDALTVLSIISVPAVIRCEKRLPWPPHQLLTTYPQTEWESLPAEMVLRL